MPVDNEQGFVFEEDDIPEPSGMEFDNEDTPTQSDLPDDLLPPEGTSNWLIKHDDGTASCTSQTMTIWGRQPETVTITAGAEDVSLMMSGIEGGLNIIFFTGTIWGWRFSL